MNTNKYFKLGLITIFLAFFGQLSFAQEVIVADTIDAEEAFGKKPITQVPLELCEQIDTCSIAKFAVVSKGGKQGIYDLGDGLFAKCLFCVNSVSHYHFLGEGQLSEKG